MRKWKKISNNNIDIYDWNSFVQLETENGQEVFLISLQSLFSLWLVLCKCITQQLPLGQSACLLGGPIYVTIFVFVNLSEGVLRSFFLHLYEWINIQVGRPIKIVATRHYYRMSVHAVDHFDSILLFNYTLHVFSCLFSRRKVYSLCEYNHTWKKNKWKRHTILVRGRSPFLTWDVVIQLGNPPIFTNRISIFDAISPIFSIYFCVFILFSSISYKTIFS